MSPRATRTLAAVLLLAAAGAARLSTARADDGAADDAAAKLIASKALATAKAPAEQWLGSYAGSCWTGATRVLVVEKDDGLRKIEIERIETRDKELAERQVDRWWIDADGAIVKGQRLTYDAGHEPPASDIRFEIKNGKIRMRGAEEPEVVQADLPKTGAFLPNRELALLAVPDAKGTVWRFATLGETAGEENDHFRYFTVEDMGKEKVAQRSGTVEARKLRLVEPGGEVIFWVDDQHRIVAGRWPSLPNLSAIAGSESDSRSDWWTRPADELDQAGEKLAKAGAALDGQVGAMTFGVYTEEGELKAKTTARLAKEEKDGKPAYHYLSETAEVTSGSTVATEEWWFAPDGKVLAGRYSVKGSNTDALDCKLRVEGDKMISSISDAPAGKEELTFPIPPRMVADSYCLFKAAAAAGAGSYRFHGFDLAARYAISILVTVKGEDEVTLLGGTAKARHLVLTQNVAEADAWLDSKGQLLLVKWKDGDLNVFGPLDKMPETLPGRLGAGK